LLCVNEIDFLANTSHGVLKSALCHIEQKSALEGTGMADIAIGYPINRFELVCRI